MIVESDADIFSVSHKTIVCPCNAAGAMGAGLALQFAKRFPELETIYRRHFPRASVNRLDRRLARKLVSVRLANGPHVILLCSKYHHQEPADLELIKTNLKQLVIDHEYFGITSLAIPPIGTGLGKISYQDHVRPLLFELLADQPFDVQIVGV